jgi:hypothetical protein
MSCDDQRVTRLWAIVRLLSCCLLHFRKLGGPRPGPGGGDAESRGTGNRPVPPAGPTPPAANPDGSVTYAGLTIPHGPAQRDDLARLRGEDPKAPYLIVARYQGDRGVCRLWPGFAGMAGLGGGS